jgi:hypothetical protein
MQAIQQGTKLKAVVKDDTPRAPVNSANASTGMLNLLATAMSRRRAHVKDDSDSDSDGGFSDSDSD